MLGTINKENGQVIEGMMMEAMEGTMIEMMEDTIIKVSKCRRKQIATFYVEGLVYGDSI